MSSVDKAIETQLKNIQTKTGQSLKQLCDRIRQSGLAKHGEIRDMLKRDLSMGHGDANAIRTTISSPRVKVPQGKRPQRPPTCWTKSTPVQEPDYDLSTRN